MKNILLLSWITFKGNFRDITSWGIGILAILLMLSTPLFAGFSMRQTVAVSIDYALTSISFIGLLLCIFISVNSMAKDIERRTIYSIVSLPLSREQYLLGKFLGTAIFIFTGIIILSFSAFLSVLFTHYLEPFDMNNTIFWKNILLSLGGIYFKLLIISGVVFLFSSISTSTFLPLILAFFFYFIGESVEEVKSFIEGVGNKELHPALKHISKFAYYIFPNLASFDFKSQAIYGIYINPNDFFMLLIYAVSYTGIILFIAASVFKRREFL